MKTAAIMTSTNDISDLSVKDQRNVGWAIDEREDQPDRIAGEAESSGFRNT